MGKLNLEKAQANGWKVGGVCELLGLNAEQEADIEIRLVLSRTLKARRLAAKQTQEVFAKRLHTSQPRLARMAAGDKTVMMDLFIKGLLASGMDRKTIGQALLAEQ